MSDKRPEIVVSFQRRHFKNPGGNTMPLTLNVGLSQKMGLPDYGSVGASCHVELELSSHMLDRNPDVFQQEVRVAFAACRQAVEEELARERVQPSASPSATCERRRPYVAWHAGTGSQTITPKQLDYAQQLAAQIDGLGNQGLDSLAHRLYERPLVDLASFEASSLINTLRQIKSGQVSLATVTDKIAA